MKTEYRLVTFPVPPEKLLAFDSVKTLTVDFAGSDPELAEQMDGWEPVGFQILNAGETLNLCLLLKTRVAVPSTDDFVIGGDQTGGAVKGVDID